MTKNLPLPPIIFPAKNSAERKRLARLRALGKVHAIGPRLYSSLPQSKVSDAVRGSWSTIVSTLFPGVLISHRTALEYKPGHNGEIILTANTNREIRYPGLLLKFIRGHKPLEDDPHFLNLRASSLPRALLENLLTQRKKSDSKAISQEEIEARLEQNLRDGGEAALNRIRDRAQEIANQFHWEKAYHRLDGMIGALLGTKSAKNIKSSFVHARLEGMPYDPACLERLQNLFGEIQNRSLPIIRDISKTSEHMRNKAFFDAYFSNYIEGTTFEVEEAEDIIFNNKIPAKRPIDAHDIMGTFRIVSNAIELNKVPRDLGDFQKILTTRHLTLMEKRPETLPGQFKVKPNRAGETIFVHPGLVSGTLKKGFELYNDLLEGLPRAIFMMFLVADVHPFTDGNGRIARIMMNAELSSANLSTIIIPNVVREDYLLALRALTRRHRPSPLVDLLIQAQKFSKLDFSSYPRILKELQRRNWFKEPDESRILF